MQLRHGLDGVEYIDPCLCSFGITEAILGTSLASALGATGLVGGGEIAADVVGGAGLGAATSGLTGGNPLTGALTGGLTGGVVSGLGPVVGDALGSATDGALGTTAGDVLAGTAAGAVGSAITGQNPLTGALEGGAGGAVSGLVSGAGGTATPANAAGGSVGTGGSAVGGAGLGAAGIAAPASIGADAFSAGGAASPELSGLQGAVTGYDVPGPATTGGDLGSSISGPSATIPAATDAAVPGGAITNNNLTQGATAGLSLGGGTTSDLGTPTGGGPTLGGFTAQDVANSNTFPIPPVPPSLDASGNPLSAGGAGVYPTPQAATAAANYDATGGNVAPGSSGVLSNLLGGNFGDALSGLGGDLKNNASWLLPGALLGFDALRGNQTTKGLNPLTSEANQLNNQSQQLESYLTNGTLPPGVQTALNQAAASAKATIRGQYAARGMSGSSAEYADLSNVDNTVVSQGSQIATQLLNTGVSEAGLSSQIYGQILNANLSQDNQLSGALSSLAAASVRPTVTLNSTTSG